MSDMTEGEMRALIREAAELLKDCRSGMTDPGLAMKWGRKRRRFLDASCDLEESPTEDPLGAPPL